MIGSVGERSAFRMRDRIWNRICVLDGPTRLICFDDAEDRAEYLAPLDALLDDLRLTAPGSELPWLITAQCLPLDYQKGRRVVVLRGLTANLPDLIDAMCVIRNKIGGIWLAPPGDPLRERLQFRG
jgi:hypothetical protein